MPRSLDFEDVQAAAARWVARREGADLSAEERRAFVAWLNADASHGEAYEQAQAVWRQTGELGALAQPQLADARAYLAQSRRGRHRQTLGLASAVLLAVLVIWGVGRLGAWDDRVYSTALGERKSISFVDGSSVDLDTASEIVVRYSRERREVQLVRGQAAFSVAHGDSRPFEVIAESGRIRDIGTRFDVRRRPAAIDVAVLEGEVEFSGRAGGPARRLRGGEGLSYSYAGEPLRTERIDVATAEAWREGRLVFKGWPLSEVLAELGRYHAASVVVSSPRTLATRLSGSVPTDNLQLALETIAATLPVKLVRTGPHSWRIDG